MGMSRKAQSRSQYIKRKARLDANISGKPRLSTVVSCGRHKVACITFAIATTHEVKKRN